MAKKARHRSNVYNQIMYITALVLFLIGLLFIFAGSAHFFTNLTSFAFIMMLIGISYIIVNLSASRIEGAQEWPMMQGLIDIILGVLLLMLSGKSQTAAIYMLAVWAALSGVVRILSEIRKKKPGFKVTLACGMSLIAVSVYLALFSLFSINLSTWVGVGVSLYAIASCNKIVFKKKQA